MSDIRYSARRLLRTPGLSLALLFTIALGIGSNVAVDGFVRGLTRRDSPLVSADGVVSVFGRAAQGGAGPLRYQEFVSLRSYRDTFEWIGAARILPSSVGLPGQSAILSVAAVTSGLAGLLNLPLDGGAVVAHDLWENEFHSDPHVRGQQIHLDGVSVRVADVTPNWLEGIYRDRHVDLWIPLDEKASHGTDRNVWVIGRLRRGISIEQAQTALRTNGGGVDELRVAAYTGMTPEMAEGFSRVRLLLSLSAALVFFIACANVAAFLVGRAYARSHETCVRVALGASRGQLAREVFADSVVISVAGGMAGVLLASWIAHILPALLFDQDAARLAFAPSLVHVVTVSVLCIAMTIVCGLLPFFAISCDRPALVLRRESAGPSTAIRRLRVGLVVAQMASCCMLVISTAFLFDGMQAALQTSVGRSLGHPILAMVQSRPFVEMRYFQDAQKATMEVSGVSAMAWASQMPGGQPAWQYFRIEPPQLPNRQIRMDIASFPVDPSKVFATPPVAGRLFGVADQNCRAAVANEEAARALFGQDTVGRAIWDSAGFPLTVIGVVARRKERGGKEGSVPTIYSFDPDRMASDQITSQRFRASIVSELQRAELDSNVVSSSYFAALGWPLVDGRIFPSDSESHGCRVAVVNQEAANLYFDGKAVGAAVIDEIGRRTGIIGVVHSAPLGTFARRAEPAIYFPMTQDYLRRMTLILGARKVNGELLADLRRRIELVPGRGEAPIVIVTLEEQLNRTALSTLRIATLIIGAFAITALALCILGLFGALSDAARERRRQIAIRIALGARRRHLVRLTLGEGGRLAFAGAAAGTLASVLLSGTVAQITPLNGLPSLWVWLAAPIVLAGAVAIASILPARRASLVNPLTIMGDGN